MFELEQVLCKNEASNKISPALFCLFDGRSLRSSIASETSGCPSVQSQKQTPITNEIIDRKP